MNPTIIVQQNIGIPTGPMNIANSTSQKNKQGKSVAAIIRPMPRDTVAKESLRFDAKDTSSPKSHSRSKELADYVKWLQEKSEQDVADTRPATQSEVLEVQPTSIATVVAKTVQAPSVLHDHQLLDTCFSSITTETDVSHEVGALLGQKSLSKPESTSDIEPPSDIQAKRVLAHGFSTTKIQRSDQPHVDLPKAYVTFNELKVGSDGMPAVSFESSHVEDAASQPDKLPMNSLSAADTEKFIATISKAIASVLTETPEPEFEQKVRSHFASELHTRAIRAIVPSEIDATDPDKLGHIQGGDLAETEENLVAGMKADAHKIASEILANGRKEIPTSVAAWDVEDFRWPVVTNQMIVSGGEALDQLAESTWNMITPGNQRVAITGLGRGEGTTSIAISLARWATACGKTVLLVDADLVTPGLSTQVGLAPNISWVNAVSQSLPPAEVIVRSQKSNLCIMPLAQMVSRVTWPHFIYDNLGDLINQIQSHFDLVIIDVGPANQMMAELSRPSLLVDATLLIYDGVNSPEFQKTKSRLEMFGLNRFVVAQNRTKQKSVNVA